MSMKKIIASFLILVLLFSLAACGAKPDANMGKYLGSKATSQGITFPIHAIYTGETWLELQSGGKGTAMMDGQELPLQWSVEEDQITFTINGVTNTGTLKDGVISVEFTEIGFILEFRKEGVPPAPSNPPTYDHAGYWELIRIDRDDPKGTAGEEDLAALGIVFYLELLEDGSGELFVEKPYPLTWLDGTITFANDNASVSYTVEGDLLFLEMRGISMVFRKGEKTEPITSEMEEAGFTQFMEINTPYPYTSLCGEDESFSTTGEAVITSYEIFDSAEGFPAMDGYEWRVVQMEIRFFDQNAQDYGSTTYSNVEDYYNTRLHDDTYVDIKVEDNSSYHSYRAIYQGQEVDIFEKTTNYWGGWQHDENGQWEIISYYEWAMRVPVGYDGCVVGLRDGRVEWLDGTYITDYDPADFLLFRLN